MEQFQRSDVRRGAINSPVAFSNSRYHPSAIMLGEAEISGVWAPGQTTEQDLHLLTDAGWLLSPVRKHEGRSMFRIPANTASVRIVPGPAADQGSDGSAAKADYRSVLVGEIYAWGSEPTADLEPRERESHLGDRFFGARALDIHLRSDQLPGWDLLEGGPCRWTCGDALLPLDIQDYGVPVMLSIHILAVCRDSRLLRSRGPQPHSG